MNSPLLIVGQLVDLLDKEGIRHCLWKGIQYLAESLAGESDLDLLVEQCQTTRIEKILKELGYKRFISQSWTRFHGVEDWIGLDSKTGKLLNIHLYYRLLIGTIYVDEYHLP